ARMDPFTDEPVLNITCDCVEPSDGKGYDRDPRTIAKRAEAYLKSSGLGDTAYFGPEPEFFVFDSVTWNVDMSGCYCKIKSEEAPFFFSSKRRHTSCYRDWSSDVCSSDISSTMTRRSASRSSARRSKSRCGGSRPMRGRKARSEERRVGKEDRGRGEQDRGREVYRH